MTVSGMNEPKSLQQRKSGQTQLTVDEAFTHATDHFIAQRYTEADQICTAIIKTSHHHIPAVNLLGIIAQKLNRHDLAVVQFEKAISIDNKRADLFYNLAISLHALGRNQEAIEVMETALTNEPENKQIVDCLNGLKSNIATKGELLDSGQELFQKGVGFHQSGQVDEAIKLYRKALVVDPENTAALSKLAVALQSIGRLEEAVINYQKAVSLNTQYADVYSNLGVALQEQGRFHEAVASFHKALQINPDFAEVYANMGVVQLEQGRINEAVVSLNKAISLRPDYADAYTTLGAAQLKLDNHRDGVGSYQKAVAIRLNSGTNIDIADDYPGCNRFFIELTNRCNFHCTFCPSDIQVRAKGEMSLGLVEKLLKEIADKKLAKTINLHQMGEPTLHSQIGEVLQLAVKHGLKVDLVTNGSTLTSDKIDLLLNELWGNLIISLQTPNMESYKLRGSKMSWEKYIGGIKRAIDTWMNRYANSGQLKSQIQIRLMKTGNQPSNVDVLADKKSIIGQINFWCDLIKGIELRYGLQPYPRTPPERLEQDWFSRKDSHYSLHTGITLNFWSNFTFANTIIDENARLKYQNTAKFCYHPFTDVAILWDGICVPCCLDYDGQLKIGDANSESLETIILDTKATTLRKAFHGKGVIPDFCRKCQADLD
ncbi:MAG: tetratricopeptide repeat protein [Magnetococcales bacterium]|nr:tetratricopeptide repeat protein [Magnetococcales bacterium]